MSKAEAKLQQTKRRFDDFYQEFYGERWGSLSKALGTPKKHAVWVNPFCPDGPPLGTLPHGRWPGVFVPSAQGLLPPPVKGASGLLPYYLMDLASVLAPLSLHVQEGERVLDLCAAPGGKTLILAQALGQSGELTSNDRSPQRRRRLGQVLDDYLPGPVRARVRVTGRDATRWSLSAEEDYLGFDKILLDAPCSSERHVLESPRHLADWAPGRSKNLARDQWAMLSAAWQALKPGGLLVYSTCALSPWENDGVMHKLFERREDAVVVPLDVPEAEVSEHGYRILPDRAGHGPFYLSCAQKRPLA